MDLLRNFQDSVRRFSNIETSRFLLYPNDLTPDDAAELKRDDAGVVWLGKNETIDRDPSSK